MLLQGKGREGERVAHNTHPSLQRLFEAKMRTSVKAYNKTYDELENYQHDPADADLPDTDYQSLKNKERLLRGMVRGSAQMLLCLYRPYEHKNQDALKEIEADFGTKGVDRPRPRPEVRDVG